MHLFRQYNRHKINQQSCLCYVQEKDFDADAFTKRLIELIMNPEELQRAAGIATSLGHPDVAGQMVRLIEQEIFKK